MWLGAAALLLGEIQRWASSIFGCSIWFFELSGGMHIARHRCAIPLSNARLPGITVSLRMGVAMFCAFNRAEISKSGISAPSFLIFAKWSKTSAAPYMLQFALLPPRFPAPLIREVNRRNYAKAKAKYYIRNTIRARRIPPLESAGRNNTVRANRKQSRLGRAKRTPRDFPFLSSLGNN
jgi:hypothetical protein